MFGHFFIIMHEWDSFLGYLEIWDKGMNELFFTGGSISIHLIQTSY